MKLTHENLKSICYDYKADRFIPKRNLDYIRYKDAELADDIIDKFKGQIISPSLIFQLLEKGINSIDELPFCKVCKKSAKLRSISKKRPNQIPRYCLSNLLRVVLRNLLMALSLIWRTLSLVNPNLSPMSSRDSGCSTPSPK